MADRIKILLIQLKRAGDVIVTTPVLAVLRERYPDAQIDFLVLRPFASLLEHHPALSRILIYDLDHPWKTWRHIRQTRYDWILDFQSSPRSALVCLTSGASHTAGYRVPFWGLSYRHKISRPQGSQYVVKGKLSLVAALTGPVAQAPAPRLVLTEEERAWARQAMPVSGPVVGIIPTHRRESRRWSAGAFADVGRISLQKGKAVWIFWGPGEESYVREVLQMIPSARMIPLTTMRQMAALFERCQMVVTNDNGPMHLAAAVGTPTITIYGPTDPACWNPGGPNHRAIQATDVSCLGCNLNACPFEHECMTHVTPETVWRAVENFCSRSHEKVQR